jgi:hypothetical protein
MKRVLMASLLVVGAAWQVQVQAAIDLSACTIPKLPTIPDGSKATEDEMITASGAIKAYLADNDKALKCMEAAKAAAGEEPLAEEQSAQYTMLYNGMVDAAHGVGDGWNTAVKAYKAQSQ